MTHIPLKGLHLLRRPNRGECLSLFVEKAQAYTFTELFALERATFKEHFGNFLVEKYFRL